MYQFDLAAEQLSTDLMLSPSSNSPIQMQLEMSLEKRRGISCAVPPSPTAFLAQKAREKRERQSVQKREKREAVCRDFWLLTRKRTTGIARLKRDNLPPFSKAPKPRRWSPWFSMAQRSETWAWHRVLGRTLPRYRRVPGGEIKGTSHNQPHTA